LEIPDTPRAAWQAIESRLPLVPCPAESENANEFFLLFFDGGSREILALEVLVQWW